MDGNGRWAQARNRPRVFGHREGVEAVRRTVRAARDLGVQCLTLFSFSTENWRRPADEVDYLLELLRQYVESDLATFVAEGVKVQVIGDRDALPRHLLALVDRVETATAHNRRFHLQIAFNYGGRNELVRAARRAAQAVLDGELSLDQLDEAGMAGFLDTADVPDPDLVIRTSGERRISNFLLWQSAYAEFVFLDVLWPDFDHAQFEAALSEYRGRERRFGGLARVNAS